MDPIVKYYRSGPFPVSIGGGGYRTNVTAFLVWKAHFNLQSVGAVCYTINKYEQDIIAFSHNFFIILICPKRDLNLGPSVPFNLN